MGTAGWGVQEETPVLAVGPVTGETWRVQVQNTEQEMFPGTRLPGVTILKPDKEDDTSERSPQVRGSWVLKLLPAVGRWL